MSENDESIKSIFQWNDFVTNKEYPYYQKLKEFLIKVLSKCDQNTAICFVSRRAFCVFLLMEKMGALDGIRTEDNAIFTDRYFMKLLRQDSFPYEKVLLVDDSAITSAHMQKAMRQLEYRIGNKKIVPMTFIGDPSRLPDEKILGFKIDIFYPRPLNDVLRLSSMETHLFNQCGVPYTVELPLMEDAEPKIQLQRKYQYEIVLDEASYEDLRQLDNAEWKYLELQMTAYLQNQIYGACLIMKNEFLKQRFPELIQNMVVRIQIVERGEQTRLVCIPFAILRSVEFDKLYQFAEIIFDGTKYWDSILSAKEQFEDFKERTYISLYRTVVYSLSYYIGLEFQEMMGIRYQKQVAFCEKLRRFVLAPDFINSIDSIFGNKVGFHFAIKMIMGPSTNMIEIRKEFNKVYEKISFSEFSFDRLRDKLLELQDELRELSSKQKDETMITTEDELSNLSSNQKDDIMITMEELERFFENHFLVPNDMRDNYLSNAISNLLSQGFLVNDLFYDKESDIIYRGFSFGENSHVFYSIEAKVFYAAVKKYYDRIREIYGGNYKSEYGHHYSHFVREIFRFFTEASLIGTFITGEQFNYYVNFFQKDPDRVCGREFLLDEHSKPYHIQMIENYVDKIAL